ncbi:hypothetical protein DV736_g2263, partial [Chaetothyriales sp. CBS 134916]
MSAPGKTKGGGVLPVNAAATKKTGAPPKQGNRASAPKLRLIVRRLPPGLTGTEFWAAIGEEWQVGKGKVEWAAFKDGKVSKDPTKPSRPARAYLKVKDQTLLDLLSAKVKATIFQDAKNTSRDLCLLGPPSLEFAPHNRMSTGRVRHDGRQGTIDQDQEFIDFLQSLTEPITNPTANGGDMETSQEKVTITPLVQYLKEKKANKAKEAAEKKSAKQREAKEAKEKKSSTVVVKGSSTGSASSSTTEKARLSKATQDTVKAIHKSVASMPANKQSSTPAKAEQKPAAASNQETSTPVPPAKRERERGSASAAARMLQRDLGLTPRPPRRARAAPSSITAPKSTNEAASSKSDTAVPTPAATEGGTHKTSSTISSAAPPTGPRSSRPTNANSTVSPAPNPGNRPTKTLPNPSSGAKSAFLKHANPSQGVTEELLRKTFEEYGTVVRCEIDKKKGLGYLDFGETESLRKAMHASPVKRLLLKQLQLHHLSLLRHNLLARIHQRHQQRPAHLLQPHGETEQADEVACEVQQHSGVILVQQEVVVVDNEAILEAVGELSEDVEARVLLPRRTLLAMVLQADSKGQGSMVEEAAEMRRRTRPGHKENSK